ncbi:MAG: hypothetical protein ACFFAU_18550 [Candidatus Hodarchaeota archaeon]
MIFKAQQFQIIERKDWIQGHIIFLFFIGGTSLILLLMRIKEWFIVLFLNGLSLLCLLGIIAFGISMIWAIEIIIPSDLLVDIGIEMVSFIAIFYLPFLYLFPFFLYLCGLLIFNRFKNREKTIQQTKPIHTAIYSFVLLSIGIWFILPFFLLSFLVSQQQPGITNFSSSLTIGMLFSIPFFLFLYLIYWNLRRDHQSFVLRT